MSFFLRNAANVTSFTAVKTQIWQKEQSTLKGPRYPILVLVLVHQQTSGSCDSTITLDVHSFPASVADAAADDKHDEHQGDA